MKQLFIRPALVPALSFILCLMTIVLFFGCKKEMQPPVQEEEIMGRGGGHTDRQVDIKLIAENLASPIGLVPSPDHSGRLFIIDQVGKIWIVKKNGEQEPIPFLDISERLVPLRPFFDERGLLGLAFHPRFRHNGRFFVYYNAPPRPGGPTPGALWDNLARISEFRVMSSNSNLADPSSERVILEIDDPQFNHNGGTLVFGPDDDYLYISIGDGGGANDVGPGHVEDWYAVNPGGNGQDIEANLWGSILRIDIDHGHPYKVPKSNPFVGRRGLDEIYAYGFRNPYRMSFDMDGENHLFAGDAGQLLYEEIDIVRKGGNYGWNVKEGTHCFNAGAPLSTLPACPDRDNLGNRLIDPVIEMLNFRNPAPGKKATTIIGGHVYRGNDIQGFRGKYIFGTFSQTPGTANAELFIAQPGGRGLWNFEEIELKDRPNDLGMYLKGFGQDLKGEVYITTSLTVGPSGTTGKVFKLIQEKRGHGDDDDDDDDDDEDYD